MTSSLPESVSREDLEELAIELRRILAALRHSGPSKLKTSDSKRGHVEYEHLLVRTRDYYRLLRAMLMVQRSFDSGGYTEEHDQIASTALYLRNRFRIVDDVNFWLRLISTWHRLNPRHSIKKSKFDEHIDKERSSKTVEIGIVTVLEHEYQSVVRRLDRIISCSNDKTYGSTILDRLRPEEDLKEYVAEKVGFGWTLGYFGNARVIVVCAGSVGEEATRDSIEFIERHLKFPYTKRGWLVVGVCAGTDRSWPIGTVLISRHSIIGLRKPKSNKYVESDVVRPMIIPGPPSDCFSLKTIFRSTPEPVKDVRVSSANCVLVREVKYACTPHVVNSTSDKAMILRSLRQQRLVEPDEAVGIEMEAMGAIVSLEEPLGVVKGVCDFADTDKASWPEGLKNFYQLYAAETAAEYVAQAIRTQISRFKRAR